MSYKEKQSKYYFEFEHLRKIPMIYMNLPLAADINTHNSTDNNIALNIIFIYLLQGILLSLNS